MASQPYRGNGDLPALSHGVVPRSDCLHELRWCLDCGDAVADRDVDLAIPIILCPACAGD